MAYTPTLWAKGDKVTSAKLNKIEQGIVDKVDKETGKTLSTNDFTDAYKTKLEGIEANADKTTIDATLTSSGAAADAKATGDAIQNIETDLDGKVAIIESNLDEKVENLKSLVGTPLKATTASAMTDTSKIYVYTGNESGYTNGDWYYHDGSAWVDGGTYNSVAVEVDKTLTVDGMPADAKVTGDEIGALKSGLNSKIDNPSEGEEGQILTNDGQGGAVWSNVGTPTDAQVGEAVNDWLDKHPEATTTVQDGALTDKKFAPTLNAELKSLSAFDGATDEEKLYDALITKAYKGVILGGNITINASISIPNASIREVKIANAIITLNDDMFDASSNNFARLPSFVNCKFIGNGHAVFGGYYGVFGNFIGCSFVDCSLINKGGGTLQSAYVAYCEVLNDTVPFIKCDYIYDCKVIGTLCERQSATFIDTYDSTAEQGGPRNLWVSDCTFESYQATVFKIACGGGAIYIKNCYFEGNANGILDLKKGENGYDILTLEISGCKVNSAVTPFAIQGFTNNYRVIISVHDNYYYTSVAGTPMVTGIPIDNMFTVYNNRKSATTDVISDHPRFVYESGSLIYPTVNTSYITSRVGGIVQVGQLVFVDMVVKAEQTFTGNIADAITNMPKSSVTSTLLEVRDFTTNELLTGKSVYLAGTSASIRGGMTDQERYLIKGFYFTDRKTAR